MTELKPCPFCGGEARLYTTESVQSYRRAVVKCKQCGAELRKEGGGAPDFPGINDAMEKRKLSNERAKQQAAEAWNTRAQQTCHDTNNNENDFTCSACGASLYVHTAWTYTMIRRGGSADDVLTRPNFCPNCGAKVVE